MAPRVELHDTLVNILGSENVYFQPPAKLVMQYPCIRYVRDTFVTNHANDRPYKQRKRYQVTVIDRNPDSDIVDQIAQLPLCAHDRFYTADNLNHDVFTIFF